MEIFIKRDCESLSYDEVRGYFRQIFEKKIIYFDQRYLFNGASQLATETSMHVLLEERMRDQFILGLKDKAIQKELFYKCTAITVRLDEIVEVSKDLEEAKSNIQFIHKTLDLKYKPRNDEENSRPGIVNTE
ncbi:hypothetical protein RF11_16265 [Thelohanellus kitauei]|uniref:Uncharacterized protein n=1 Tax=Thelohanellus kitauei TaxID=669202 RepID=A0A0C2MLW8_THEKT|nr:hypothetical protein RF11_16265 [Thelohanellus kitauei]